MLVPSLSGIVYAFHPSRGIVFIAVGDFAHVETYPSPVPTSFDSTTFVCVGSIGRHVVSLKLSYSDGRLLRILAYDTKQYVVVDASGYDKFKAALQAAEEVIALDDAVISNRRDTISRLSDDIDRLLAAGDPSKIVDQLRRNANRISSDVLGNLPSGDAVSDLTTAVEELSRRRNQVLEEEKDLLNEWRRLIPLPSSEYNRETLSETRNSTSNKLAAYEARADSIDDEAARNAIIIDRLNKEVLAVYLKLFGRPADHIETAADDIVAYLLPRQAERNFGINGSRFAHCNDLLAKIGDYKRKLDDLPDIESRAYPTELSASVDSLRNKLNDMIARCDARKESLQRAIAEAQGRLSQFSIQR